MLPALTPRLANSLALRLPASLRAAARWNAERMTKALRRLREELPREQQARYILEFMTGGVELMRAAHSHPDVLHHILETSGEMMADAAAMADEQLGQSIAGVAADFSLRLARGMSRFVEEHWETIAEDEEVKELLNGTPAEELIDMDSLPGEFLRGQYMALVLIDALEEGCDSTVVSRVAVAAAQGLLRACTDPWMRRFPNPFLGESREQSDERMLQYVRIARTASSEAEREVILNLRTVHLQLGSRLGPLVDLTTGFYRETLGKLA